MEYKIFATAIFAMALPLAAQADAIGDETRGKDIFRKCATCHQVGTNAKHRVGPILNGVFGRKAGTADGYTRYSEGLTRAGNDGLVWDLEHLDAYLANPKSLVSRTTMNFAGLKDAQDRADLIAYLRVFSDNPANIPEAEPTGVPPEVTLAPEILAIVGDPEYGEYLSSNCC